MCKSQKYLSMAVEQAKQSTMSYKHGCVIVKSGNFHLFVLSIIFIPLFFRYSRYPLSLLSFSLLNSVKGTVIASGFNHTRTLLNRSICSSTHAEVSINK